MRSSKSDRILWGVTRYYSRKIPIYVNHAKDFKSVYAVTYYNKRMMFIDIAPDVAAGKRILRTTLIHEFTHCVEYLNKNRYLSPRTVKECTHLAQTMEVGMTQLICNLRVGKKRFRW